jgi:hypothetical protein
VPLARTGANNSETAKPSNSETAKPRSRRNRRNRSHDKTPKLIVLRPSLMGLAVGFLWDLAERDVEAVHGDDTLAAVRDYLKHRLDAADEAPLHGLAEPVGRMLPAALALLKSFERVLQ